MEPALTQSLIEVLQPAIQLILAAVASTISGYIIYFLRKILKVTVTKEEEARIQALGVRAVLLVEEKARNMLKENNVITSKEKRASAARYVFNRIDGEMPEAYKIVDHAVAATRGVGATG